VRRDLIPGRHWAVCACCLVVAGLPLAARERLRGRLLDASVRLGARPPLEEADGPRALALRNQLSLEVAQRRELERALEEVHALSVLTDERTDLGLVPAEAYALSSPADLVRRLVLGRGERDGVVKGAPVMSGAALVGLVANVTRERAEVRLTTDPTFRMRVSVPRLGIEGMLSGTGGPLLTFAPAVSGDDDPGKNLVAGDALVVSRASTLCSVPALLGHVREVKHAPGEAASRASVVPAVPAAQITRVVVVRNVDESLARRPGAESEGR
jgi:rod shape-determining protein MreC